MSGGLSGERDSRVGVRQLAAAQVLRMRVHRRHALRVSTTTPAVSFSDACSPCRVNASDASGHHLSHGAPCGRQIDGCKQRVNAGHQHLHRGPRRRVLTVPAAHSRLPGCRCRPPQSRTRRFSPG